MKMLKDYMEGMLKGESEVITVSDLRAHLGDIFKQVSLGKSFCIRRRGAITAFLVAPGNADMVHEVLPDGSCPALGIEARTSEDEQ